MKRFIAAVTVVCGVAYALHRVHWRGWHRGWIEASDSWSWRELEY